MCDKNVELIKSGVPIVSIDFTGCNLENEDFSGIEFKKCIFDDISNIKFRECKFEEVKFIGKKYINVDFTEATFEYVTAVGLKFVGCTFIESNVSRSNFCDTIFEGSNMTGFATDKTKFHRANFKNTILENALFNDNGNVEYLTDANFEGANLKNCEFTRTAIKVNFRGANFEGVKVWGQINYSGSDFENAVLTGMKLSKSLMNKTNFRNAELSKANLTDADLTDADLTGANLTGANLTRTNFKDANLTNADLTDADVTNTNFRGALVGTGREILNRKKELIEREKKEKKENAEKSKMEKKENAEKSKIQSKMKTEQMKMKKSKTRKRNTELKGIKNIELKTRHTETKKYEKMMKNITKRNISSDLFVDYVKNKDKDVEEGLFKNLLGNFKSKSNALKQDGIDNQINRQYLNMICSNSGECLVFGRETDKIRNLFNNFTDFSYLKSVKKTGSDSGNGFALQLAYQNGYYKTNALLKSSHEITSDNLYYEYLVGTQFINKVNKCLPCFTETYHLFTHKDKLTKQSFVSDNGDLNSLSINNCDNLNVKSINDIKECLNKSCEEGENYAILVQYIEDAISLDDIVEEYKNDYVSNHRTYIIIGILYQIYTALSYLQNDFTHYDLHTGNVILYKLKKGKFVTITYVNEKTGITTKIKTNYIAKIIDYGRSYFGNLGNSRNLTSTQIGKAICGSKCKSDCGENEGYNFFGEKSKHEDNFTRIISTTKNYSHDLRLLLAIFGYVPRLSSFLKVTLQYEGTYGTNELESTNIESINNVMDAQLVLQSVMDEGNFGIDENDTSLGELIVYLTNKKCTKNMEFISA